MIEAIEGVAFFFSAISAVSSNANTKKGRSSNTNDDDTYPCVAFFIVYESSDKCHEETFFAALHNQDVEPEITPIRVRTRGKPDLETAARQLFQTVKDHNNPSVQEMLNASNTYCYSNAPAASSESEEEEDEESEEEFCPVHFPTSPCCFVIVNHEGYLEEFDAAIERTQSDGLVVETTRRPNFHPPASDSPSTDVISTIRKVERVMHLSKHALYRGDIYATPDGAQFTYRRLMDVGSYLNKLLVNEAINQQLVKNMKSVQTILSHPACEIIEQLAFDLNLIEVSNGVCFDICSRAFIANAIQEANIGKLSPRAYIPYDSSTPPQPLYFRQGLYNSFPDVDVRTNLMNKFYQCLLAHKIPQKTRKLVVAGPRDSGKTSWARILQRIVTPQYIASITNERQFSAAMIKEDTQLVIIDEWCANTMSADLAKTILQGGWLVTAVKHAQPRHVTCHSPFYITTNAVPDFDEENANVQRRVEIFTTSSLPTITPDAYQWMYDHAMDCIAWAAEEITTHRHLIHPEERWYEDAHTLSRLLPSVNTPTPWHRREIVQITDADLHGESATQPTTTHDTIHASFTMEARRRRMMRKRPRARPVNSTASSSDKEHQPNVVTSPKPTESLRSPSTPTTPAMTGDGNDSSTSNSEGPTIAPAHHLEHTSRESEETFSTPNVPPSPTALAESDLQPSTSTVQTEAGLSQQTTTDTPDVFGESPVQVEQRDNQPSYWTTIRNWWG